MCHHYLIQILYIIISSLFQKIYKHLWLQITPKWNHTHVQHTHTHTHKYSIWIHPLPYYLHVTNYVHPTYTNIIISIGSIGLLNKAYKHKQYDNHTNTLPCTSTYTSSRPSTYFKIKLIILILLSIPHTQPTPVKMQAYQVSILD